jgi:hypothetical protein
MKRIRTRRSIILGVCLMSILWISFFWLSTSVNAGLQDGLIAHYPFDGGPLDMGPKKYNGIEKNGVSLTDDRFGRPDRAYSFDGEDDYIAAGNFPLPPVFSLTMWINPTDITDGRMFLGKQSANATSQVKVGFSKGGYGVVIGTAAYADGEKDSGWQHLAVVVEKTSSQYNRVLFYKNGRLLWSKNHFDPLEDTRALPIAIGAAWEGTSPVSFFSGKMDDIRIYDRALSQTEIELLYNPIQCLDIDLDDDIDGEELWFFSKNYGKKRWYRDRDKDGYSDGTSRWGHDRPGIEYYTKTELKDIFGDCDDLDSGVNPDLTGPQCPPFGACCYIVEENCKLITRCDDNVSGRVCITELNGTFHKNTQCSDLTPDECPVVDENLGACCQTMLSEDGSTYAVCTDDVINSECADNSGSFFAGRHCTDLSSEECPVPAETATGTGSCCHPKISYVNESGVFPVQCLDSLTEYKCKLLQGSWNIAQTCADLTESECAPFGACCYDDTEGLTKCANWMLETNCTELGGTFFADQQCSEISDEACGPSPDQVGSCCRPKISYVNESGVFPVQCLDSLTEYKCKLLQGSWYAYNACADLTAEQCQPLPEITGACCQTMLSEDGITSAVCNNDVTISECADNGGSFFADRQCSELSSGECPVPAQTGSCCHPKISYVNESGVFPVQCLDSLTEYKCKLLQGKWNQAQACTDLTESECAPFGACCYDDAEGTKKCANWMLENNCDKLEGTFSPNLKCSEIECVEPPAAGACCLSQSTGDSSSVTIRCVDARTQGQCTTLGGSWYEDQACTDLTYAQCPPITETTGACCQTMISENGTTSAVCNNDVASSECADNGGSFFADRQCSELSSGECPVPAPTGSCCHPKISYVNESGVFPVQCLDSLTEYKCKLLQGSWNIAQTCADLTESECAPFGACCYDDAEGVTKCANWMLESSCKKLDGTFYANERCSELTEGECATVPPSEGACCLSQTGDDGSTVPVRCVDARSQSQCKTLGGSWYEDAACNDLTAEECPPLPDEITGSCCQTILTKDGSTAVCNDDVTSSECVDNGGSFFADRQCSELSSNECPVSVSTGSCCYLMSDQTYKCADFMTNEDCKSLSNIHTIFYENLPCDKLPETSPCHDPYEISGVCCFLSQGPGLLPECSVSITQTECQKEQGMWVPGGQDCSDCYEY